MRSFDVDSRLSSMSRFLLNEYKLYSHTHKFFFDHAQLYDPPLCIRSLSEWVQTALEIMGWSWGRWGEKGTDPLYNERCPVTAVVNQPQMAPERICSESQWGPLTVAACLLVLAENTVTGIDWRGSKRLMKREKALSFPCSFAPRPSPHPPWVSQGNSYFESTWSVCERELSLSNIIRCMILKQWLTAVILTCMTGALKPRFAGMPLTLRRLPHL